jgi:hypothetical protein
MTSFEHQIVFRVRKGKAIVSCKCRAVYGKHDRRGGDYFLAIPSEVGDNFWELYNQPENHFAPFADSDRIKVKA